MKAKFRVRTANGLTGIAALACSAALAADLPSGGVPQSRAEAADSIEEVIVTARRKEENLQVVPISVTAISGQALVDRGIVDLQSLAPHVPSLRISAADGNNPKKISAGIRGLRSNSSQIDTDPTVGIYFAEGGVFHPYGLSSSLYDIQSVQVLKGPQGTLFGKNTTGGALLIEPNKPGFDGVDGDIKLGVGNYNMRRFEGMVNIPISDTVAFRGNYVQNERDGFTRVLRGGQLLGSADDQSYRLQLTVKPTANITSNTLIDWLDDHGSPTQPVLVGQTASLYLTPTSTAAAIANAALLQKGVNAQMALGPWLIDDMVGSGVPMTGKNGVAGWIGDAFNPANCPSGNGRGKALCRSGNPPKQLLEMRGILNNTAIDLGQATLKNIFSIRQTHYFTELLESSPTSIILPGIEAMFYDDVHQVSDELQLSGKALDDRLDWITGLYFAREAGHDVSLAYQLLGIAYTLTTGPTAGVPGGSWTRNEARPDNRTKAVFVQGDYKLTEQWKLTAGARETWDERSGQNMGTTNADTLCASLNPATNYTTAQAAQTPNCINIAQTRSWSAPTWNLSLSYQADPDTMWYATARRGYKSGGFNTRAVAGPSFSYDPEYVTDLELGVKSDGHLGSMPIRTNASVFNSDYTNQQLQSSQYLTSPFGSRVITTTLNVGKSKIYGGEIELTLLPVHDLEIGVFLSYANARFLEYGVINPATNAIVDIHDVPWGTNGGNAGLADYQAGINGRYTWALAERGTMVFSADASFRSHTVTDNAGVARKYPFVTPVLPEPGYGVLNLRADWRRFWGNPVDLAFFVNNAGDKAYFTGGTVVANYEAALYAPPRTFGLELTYRFGDGSKAKD